MNTGAEQIWRLRCVEMTEGTRDVWAGKPGLRKAGWLLITRGPRELDLLSCFVRHEEKGISAQCRKDSDSPMCLQLGGDDLTIFCTCAPLPLLLPPSP